MKRRTIGSVVIVVLTLLIKRVLEPDKHHIVEKNLSGGYRIHSIEPSKLDPLKIVGGGELDFDGSMAIVSEYDPETHTAYVDADDLAEAGDSR